ncbi:MAG: exosortase [Phycisphaerales bacterium]|nr:MAG: exosortase [Phycisphaerales bacterium]
MDWVILAGNVGHQTCWVGGLPRPLLPLPNRTLIDALLAKCRYSSDGSCTICTIGHSDLFARHLKGQNAPDAALGFFEDNVPRGTAGCLKACESRLKGETILVAGAAVWLEDDPSWMLEQHRSQGNALTVFCNDDPTMANGGGRRLARPAGVYCCEPEVLSLIHPAGYQDLKEQLIPELKRVGLRVGAANLRGTTLEVLDWKSYLRVLGHVLTARQFETRGFRQLAPDIWCGEGTEIASQARIVGPALLGRNCRIEDEAIIIGPAMLGDECSVGNGTWLVRVVAPSHVSYPASASLTDQVVSRPEPARPRTDRVWHRDPRVARSVPSVRSDAEAGLAVGPRPLLAGAVVPGAVLATVFVWAFWHTLADLWQTWRNDADYSAGQLVPLAAAYMLVTRRNLLRKLRLSPAPAGFVVFAAGLLIHLLGGYYLYGSLQNIGMLICANGLIIGLIGWSAYRCIWYPLLFMFLMLPLPNRIHDAVTLPLQGVGAQISATILEIVGVPAVRYGNVLEVGEHHIAVAEACSGLRMALAFLIVTGVFAYVIRRPGWQKLVVLLSSIPIAVACNVLRIVVAAYLYDLGYGWLGRGAFHDAAGLLMVPVALCLVCLELWVLSNLVVPKGKADALVERIDQTAVASGT